MLRVCGRNTQSDATDSYVPSNTRPTSSPLPFSVAEPEFTAGDVQIGEEIDGNLAVGLVLVGTKALSRVDVEQPFRQIEGGVPVFFFTASGRKVNRTAPGCGWRRWGTRGACRS